LGLEKPNSGLDRGETLFPNSGSDLDSDETFQISRNVGLDIDEIVCLLDSQLCMEHNHLPYNAPILLAHRWFHFSYWLTEQFVRLAYFQANRLLAEGDICAPINWRIDAPRAITIGRPMVSLLVLADRTVRGASPIFKPIAY
jgi:hypothetical protein